MLKSFRAAVCIIALAGGPLPSSMPQSYAQALAPITIGAFANSLRALVKELENSAHSLIDQGNISLAQQQMLLAGILTNAVQQISTAYGGALDKTFGQLSVAEQNTFNQLANLVKDFDKLENKTASDIQSTIYKTQGATNQLLDRLPVGQHFPIFYGVTVRDLALDPLPNQSDIEILGFHLSSPELDRKKPIILVGGEQLPPEAVSVQEDRVLLQVPEALKQKIGFGGGACNPRGTFPIIIRTFWPERRGFWPITWSSERETSFNANALPGAQIYQISISYDAVRTSNALKQESFSARSGYTAMGCEETTSASARFEMPPGSQEIQCTASWVDTSNIKHSSQNCAVGGVVATGSGSITGRDRQCFVVGEVIGWIVHRRNSCNCPGGGHGTLQIAGTYKVPDSKVENLKSQQLGIFALRQGGDVFASLPVDSSTKITRISIETKRKQCDAKLDDISINIPNAIQEITQTSTDGMFRAKIWNGQITVSRNQ